MLQRIISINEFGINPQTPVQMKLRSTLIFPLSAERLLIIVIKEKM